MLPPRSMRRAPGLKMIAPPRIGAPCVVRAERMLCVCCRNAGLAPAAGGPAFSLVAAESAAAPLLQLRLVASARPCRCERLLVGGGESHGHRSRPATPGVVGSVGSMTTGVDPAALLHRHVPVLRYDPQEPYFADAASEWTDNPGNQLRRADGTVIAVASADSGQARLSLSFLGPTRYANGDGVTPDERIADPSHDYVAQARALHAQPQYANCVYGHSATGSDGRLWLAYWFWYFYNLQRLQPDRASDQSWASRRRLGDDPAASRSRGPGARPSGVRAAQARWAASVKPSRAGRGAACRVPGPWLVCLVLLCRRPLDGQLV
jgi:hypothetical protein